MTAHVVRLHVAGAPADARPIRIGMLVGSVGDAGGGVAASVRDMARALARQPGIAVIVFGVADARPNDVDRNAWSPAALELFPMRGPSVFGFARGLVSALEQAEIDILHVHGLWMYISIAARLWAARSGRPYVVSPHGMLDPWALANSGWKKALALRAYERRHLNGAACVHALCDDELRAIRAFGLRNPACVIPNGVALPALSMGPSGRPGAERLTLLFLGRLTPKKGLVPLIEAWAAFKARPCSQQWTLEIAGSGAPDFVEALKALIELRGVANSVRLVGHRAGEDKSRTFAAADAFILPSVSEGQPLAVLEAWAHGLPTLLTAQCNLPEGFEAGAAMRIGTSAEHIARGIENLASLSDAVRIEMGRRGRRLAETEFSWRGTAGRWSQEYRRLVGG